MDQFRQARLSGDSSLFFTNYWYLKVNFLIEVSVVSDNDLQ